MNISEPCTTRISDNLRTSEPVLDRIESSDTECTCGGNDSSRSMHDK